MGIEPLITIFAGGLLFGAVFYGDRYGHLACNSHRTADFRHGGLRWFLDRLYPQVYPLCQRELPLQFCQVNALVPLLDRLTVPLRFGVECPEQRFQGTVAGIAHRNGVPSSRRVCHRCTQSEKLSL